MRRAPTAHRIFHAKAPPLHRRRTKTETLILVIVWIFSQVCLAEVRSHNLITDKSYADWIEIRVFLGHTADSLSAILVRSWNAKMTTTSSSKIVNDSLLPLRVLRICFANHQHRGRFFVNSINEREKRRVDCVMTSPACKTRRVLCQLGLFEMGEMDVSANESTFIPRRCTSLAGKMWIAPTICPWHPRHAA